MAKKKSENSGKGGEMFPLLALEDVVVLPALPQPVHLHDDTKYDLVYKAFTENLKIVAAWIKRDEEKENEAQLMKTATLCKVDKFIQVPGAPSLAFLMPVGRVTIANVYDKQEKNGILAEINKENTITIQNRNLTPHKLQIKNLEDLFSRILNFLPEVDRKNAETMINDFSKSPAKKIYAMAHVAPLTTEECYQLLECNDYASLLATSILLFDRVLQRLSLQASINEKTHRELSQQQKEVFLRTQLKHIRNELGEAEDADDIFELNKRAESKKWSGAAQAHFSKELNKLKRLNISNPEYSVQYAYLETLLDLPWENYPEKPFSLKKVAEKLDNDHFGLEKVKERVIEHMAVLKLRKDLKAPIICLYGPPGVGKTSIGKSIAEAMGREYVRISLGGVHDESEIRGHRRTYIGAMPGRFLKALSKCTTGNPLMLLDEIDKVGKDYKGDPSSALLEALDPEQNNTFHDNFIDFPYDLSKIFFIATANDLSTIPAPLRDRMEVIEMNGYIPSEKKEIALRHLVKKAVKDSGFSEDEIKFSPEAIDYIIKYHTREAGVRLLEKKIAKTLRRTAHLKVLKKDYPKIITPELVAEYLGKKEVYPESYENNDFAGVATGLAWTPNGGDILFIETSLAPGKGEKLTLTGNLGDVMKESAVIALQYLKSHATEYGISRKVFESNDVHIHVPEGAVPKDGPSAGITIATSLASAFTGRRIAERTGMTGELTLRGKVLPVGGIKEKIIAAKGAGIKTIILSEENRRDIEEIAPQYIEGLDFIYVSTLQEVLRHALLEELAPYRFNVETE